MALVSQQLPCPACIAGRGDGLALQAALALPGLVLKEVTASRLRPHELARARPLEPLGGAAVRLHLRHLFLSSRGPLLRSVPRARGDSQLIPLRFAPGGCFSPLDPSYAPAFSTLPAPLPAPSPAADPATGPFRAGPARAVGAAGSPSLCACGETPDATPAGTAPAG